MYISTSWYGNHFCAKMIVFWMVCYIGKEEMRDVPFVHQHRKHFKSLLINLTNGVLYMPHQMKSEHKVKEMHI